MNYKELLKNGMDEADARLAIIEFLTKQEQVQIAYEYGSFPLLEYAEYRYFKGEHYVVIPHLSIFYNVFKANEVFSAFMSDGKSLKLSKRLYLNVQAIQINTLDTNFMELLKVDTFFEKMLKHGAKFYKLNFIKATMVLNPNQAYDLDTNLNVSFADTLPNGRKRYINSRHVLMTYQDREVILNVIVEEGVYYALTKADSNKIAYLKQGGICKIYDGKNNSFNTKIELLTDTDYIFKRLNDTNNAYFKDNHNLVGLKFINPQD